MSEQLVELLKQAQQLLGERQDEQSKRLDTHWEVLNGLLKITTEQAKAIESLTQGLKSVHEEVEQWLKH